jgi:hypothetical protein
VIVVPISILTLKSTVLLSELCSNRSLAPGGDLFIFSSLKKSDRSIFSWSSPDAIMPKTRAPNNQYHKQLCVMDWL